MRGALGANPVQAQKLGHCLSTWEELRLLSSTPAHIVPLPPATLASLPPAWLGLKIPHHLGDGRSLITKVYISLMLGPSPIFFFSQFSLIPGRVGVDTPTLQMERLRLRMKQLLRSSFPVRKVSGEPGDSLCWNSFSRAVAPRERKERRWKEACQPSFPSWCPEGQQLLCSGSWHW